MYIYIYIYIYIYPALSQYLLFMSFSMSICKRGPSGWLYELL